MNDLEWHYRSPGDALLWLHDDQTHVMHLVAASSAGRGSSGTRRIAHRTMCGWETRSGWTKYSHPTVFDGWNLCPDCEASEEYKTFILIHNWHIMGG